MLQPQLLEEFQLMSSLIVDLKYCPRHHTSCFQGRCCCAISGFTEEARSWAPPQAIDPLVNRD